MTIRGGGAKKPVTLQAGKFRLISSHNIIF